MLKKGTALCFINIKNNNNSRRTKNKKKNFKLIKKSA